MIRPLASTPAAYVPGEVIVKLKPEPGLECDTFVREHDAKLLDRLDTSLLQMKLAAGQSTEEAVKELQDDPRVEYAEPNFLYQLDEQEPPQAPDPVTPDDMDEKLWALHNTGKDGGKKGADIKGPEAWGVHRGRRDGPIIAILDTGVDTEHPDLKANLWVNTGEIPGDGLDNDNNGIVDDVYGFNASNDTGDVTDTKGHGTHLAGTIGAVGDNGEGVVGVSQEARMMIVKIFDETGNASSASIIKGVLYASKMGARITNNSYGGDPASRAVRDAFQQSPCLHIMSAGNNGTNNDIYEHYPSNYFMKNKIAVAASDNNDKRARFSNYGPDHVEIAAPGKNIYSTLPGGTYGYKSGSSMATPHVAGVAGLVASMYPKATNDELKEAILKGGARMENWVDVVSSGCRLDAYGALTRTPLYNPAPK